MKFFKIFASVFFLGLVIQACILPKYFYWQVPSGLAGFYLAFFSLCFSKPKTISLCSVLIWLFASYAPTTDKIDENSGRIKIESAGISFEINPETLSFEKLPNSYKPVQPQVADLQQKTGRVTLIKLINPEGKELSLAAIELGGLYSFLGWEQNKILLRRLAAILRQENGQVIIFMRGNGPFFQSVAKGFAYQTRAEKIFTNSLVPQLFGFGSDLVFERT